MNDLFGWEILSVMKNLDNEDDEATIIIQHKETEEVREATANIFDIPVSSLERHGGRR
ncbi:MAG: hypothetical protein ABIO63_09015 [Casimicrobiaceae bacterium]